MRTGVIVLLLALLSGTTAGLPTAWEWASDAAPGGAPAAAELDTASPGLETVGCGGGEVYCLDATGAVFWTYTPDTPGQFYGVAVMPAREQQGVSTKAAVLALSDTALVCLDGAMGRPVWTVELAGAPDTWPVWADLDGDGAPEAVAMTTVGVAVFEYQGAPRWTYPEAGAAPFKPIAPPAVGDADGDGVLEVYAAGGDTLVCLEQDGYLRWAWTADTPLAGAPALADANDDGIVEVYCQSADGRKLYALDAAYGDPLWEGQDAKAADTGEKGGAGVLVAGLNADRMAEVIAVTAAGRVCVYTAEGKPLWCFQDAQSGPRHAAVGDVDGDGIREILLAAGKTLYCLSEAGTPEWRQQFGGPLTQAPVLADIDGDKQVEALLAGAAGGGKGVVRCLDAAGPALAPLLPWPMAGAGPMRQGAALRFEDIEEVLYWDTQPVLEAGFNLADGAEAEAKAPGWSVMPDDTEWALDGETLAGGTAAVRAEPAGATVTLVSAPAPVSGEVREVSGSVLAKGEGAARAAVRWQGEEGLLREDAMRRLAANDQGWRRFMLDPVGPPLGARSVTLALVSEGEAPVWWDEAQLTAERLRVPRVEIRHNQVGYDLHGAKMCTVRANFEPLELQVDLVDLKGGVVHRCGVRDRGNIRGAYGHDWGYTYYRGVFSEYAEAGEYRLRAIAGETTVMSAPFRIEKDLLWEMSLETLLKAFQAYRWPEMDAPACLNAAVPGGWVDGSECHNRNSAEYAWVLATAHKLTAWRLQTEESRSGRAFLEEARTARDWLIARADAGEPAPMVAAAAARLARLTDGGAALVAAARKALERALAKQTGETAPILFNAAFDLYVATEDESDAKRAQDLMPGPNAEAVDTLLEYESEFGDLLSVGLAVALIEQADELVARADNGYGVCPYKIDGQPNFFGTPEGAMPGPGNTAQVLQAAALVAKTYKFNPVPAYRDFIYDQLNWVLGCNPNGVCLVKGLGGKGLTEYHHCPCAPEAPVGAVAHGFTGRAAGDDRPWLDTATEAPDPRTSGFSLENTAAWINALAWFKRVRLGT